MPFRSESEAAGYVASMIDGEGTVSLLRTRSGNRTCKVRITNTDWGLILATAQALEVLGVEHTIVEGSTPKKAGWSRRWDVQISTRAGLQRLADVVELRSTKKRERLGALLAAYKRAPRPAREELERLYTIEKKSCAELMQLLGAKSTSTVFGWLRYYGIERRSLTEAAVLDWEKRKVLHAV